MSNIKLDFKSAYYPSPIVLVGVMADGRPNCMTAAWFTKVNNSPPMIAVSLGSGHFTVRGIKENKAFSINIPEASIIEKTDYCGLVSGQRIDKSNVFTPFYGQLDSAPMIQEAMISMECTVAEIISLPQDDLVIGAVVETYANEKYVSEGHIDPQKAVPFCYVSPEKKSFGLGIPLGAARGIGKKTASPISLFFIKKTLQGPSSTA